MTLTAGAIAQYAQQADKRERNPVSEDQGRATVPMGRGFGLWQRMNPGVQLVYVTDMEGRARALTPRQAEVASLAASMVDGPMYTMRDMARSLGVAPSTVSRALVKLSAWGIIAYVVGRGRFAGLVIIRRVHGDGLERFRKAAQARVKRWHDAANRRISRLAVNVAPYFLGGVEGVLEATGHGSSTNTYMGATLTTQRVWTDADMAEIV